MNELQKSMPIINHSKVKKDVEKLEENQIRLSKNIVAQIINSEWINNIRNNLGNL